MWRAPGDVIIEESAPGAGFGAAGYAQPSRDAPPGPPPYAQETFTPAAPEDVQRPGRRLPEVDDFPVVGQREYRAKAGQYAEPQAGSAPRVYDEPGNESPPARAGIFQRLVAAGRGREADNGNRTGDTPRDGRRREAPQLPFFFNKDKR